MPVTPADIVFYPGEHITDDAHGGGSPRYWPIPSGVTNNLFDGVDPLRDTMFGSLSIRKVFAGLVNADAAGFANGYAFVDDEPSNSNMTSVLFAHGGRATSRSSDTPPGAYETLVNAEQFVEVSGEPDFPTITPSTPVAEVTLVTDQVVIAEGDLLRFFGSSRAGQGAATEHGVAYVSHVLSTGVTTNGIGTTTVRYVPIGATQVRGDTMCSRMEPAPQLPEYGPEFFAARG
jgi:hypothetical protein